MKAVISTLAVFCGLLMAPVAVQADLDLTYDVNIVQTTANIGDTIDWQVFATISGTPNSGSNLGIATVSVDLDNSSGDAMSAGTVDPAFAGYIFQHGGTPSATGLNAIGAFALNQFPGAVGQGAGGSFLIASGQYTVTQAGIHTLQSSVSGDATKYFESVAQQNFLAPSYNSISYGSDSLTVTAVPEPSSLVLTGLAAMGAWRFRRRKAAVSPDAAT